MAYEGTNCLILAWVWAWKSFHVFCIFDETMLVLAFLMWVFLPCVLLFKVMNVKV